MQAPARTFLIYSLKIPLKKLLIHITSDVIGKTLHKSFNVSAPDSLPAVQMPKRGGVWLRETNNRPTCSKYPQVHKSELYLVSLARPFQLLWYWGGQTIHPNIIGAGVLNNVS